MKGTHENSEEYTLIVSDRCPPGASRKRVRHLSQEYLRQGNFLLGLSFYALVGSVMHMDLDGLQALFSANTRARAVSVFLLVRGIVFYLLWLREDIPALVAGTIPPGVIQANLPTNPVHVLDVGLYLPAMLITALLLWRRKLLGYLLAGALLVFNILTGTAILVIFLVMSSRGMPTSIGIEAFIAIIIAVSLVLSVLYIREVE